MDVVVVVELKDDDGKTQVHVAGTARRKIPGHRCLRLRFTFNRHHQTTINTFNTFNHHNHRPDQRPNALTEDMKTLLLLPRLLAALLAASPAALAQHIHILDVSPAPPAHHAPASVSPAAARLILAARLGVSSRFAVGASLDDPALAAVASLGG